MSKESLLIYLQYQIREIQRWIDESWMRKAAKERTAAKELEKVKVSMVEYEDLAWVNIEQTLADTHIATGG